MKYREIEIVLQRVFFAAGNHIAFIEDLGSEPLRFPVGVGHGVHLVDPEMPRGNEIRFNQDMVVAGKFPVIATDELGGILHQDRHPREEIDRMAREDGKVSFPAVHGVLMAALTF